MSIEDVVGKEVTEVFPGVSETGLVEVFQSVWETGEMCLHPTTLYSDDRMSHWVENAVYKLHSGEIAAIYHDVTEREQAIQDYRKSEAKYRELYEMAPIAYFSVDINSKRIIQSNRAATALLGYDEQALKGKGVFDLYMDSSFGKKEARALFQKVAFGESLEGQELEMLHKDGSSVWVSLSVRPVFDNNGRVIETRSMALDITEKKMFEKKLSAEEERLRVTLRSIGDGVITTDLESRVVMLNEVAEVLTGWKTNDAKGKPLMEVFRIINEKTRKIVENPVQKVISTGSIIGLANDTILIAKDGTERIIADSGSPIWGLDGQMIGTVLVFRDITEKIQMQTELQVAQKMEAIGTLAGGIAHEFNNALSVIIGNAELALADLPDILPAKYNLQEVLEASMRAKDVVWQLLNYSRKSSAEKTVAYLTSSIKESIRLIRATTPSNIKIFQNIQENIAPIRANIPQIHQVLINLCTNAVHAMEEKGDLIEIVLENTLVEEGTSLSIKGISPGRYVKMSVRDNGSGMVEKHLKSIFDPFFTTKPVGKGTGMGLSVVHGIVNDHGGKIFAESTLGEGTKICVYFPAVEDRIVEQAGEKASDYDLGNGETVLFLDDEESIVKMSHQMLEKLGYNVLSFSCPRKALEAFSSDPEKVDFIISDMTMPEMTGDIFAEKIMAIKPNIPVALCTGYSDKIDKEKAQKIGIASVLLKPVSLKGMADTISQCLKGK